MFETKVFLTNEGIFIGKKKISWNSIAGIRIIKDNAFCLLFYNDKSTIEIFIINGYVLSLSKTKNIFFDFFDKKNKIKISIEEATYIIKNNSTNTNKKLNNWLEWRIIIPTVIFQIIGTFFLYLV